MRKVHCTLWFLKLAQLTFDLEAPWSAVLIGWLPATPSSQTLFLPHSVVATIDSLINMHRTQWSDRRCQRGKSGKEAQLYSTAVATYVHISVFYMYVLS